MSEERKYENLEKRVIRIEENYVSFATFSWVLGILMAIVIGLFAVIYARIEKLDDTASETNKNVSFIQGVLNSSVHDK